MNVKTRSSKDGDIYNPASADVHPVGTREELENDSSDSDY